MTRKEYEALISQPNVIAEDLLDDIVLSSLTKES